MSKAKIIVNLVTFLLLGILIYFSRDQVIEAFAKLEDINWLPLVFFFPVIFLSSAAIRRR